MGYIIGLMSAVFWGLGPIFIKKLLVYFTPIEVAVYRYMISGLFFTCWVVVSKTKIKIEKEDWIKIIGSSALGISAFAVVFGFALQYISASLGGILNGLIPIITILIDRLYRKNKLSSRVLVSIVLSILGVVLISVFDGGGSSNILLGTSLTIIALVGWVVFTFVSEGLNRKYGSLQMLMVQSLIGAFILVPFATRSIITNGHYLSNPTVVMDLLILGIGASAGGYGCYMIGVQRTNIQFMSFVMNLIPVVSLLLAATLLGERVVMTDAIGLTMILVSIWYVAPKKAEVKEPKFE